MKNIEKKRKKYSKYIDYDYEKAYMANIEMLHESFIDNILNNKNRCVYATKEITSGEQFEVEIYPEFTRKQRELVPKEGLKKDNSKAQKNLNDKNARKYLTRLLNTNFSTNDIWITLTYTDENIPSDIEEAIKNVNNYIRRINYERKKKGLPNAKYIYVTEWIEGKDNKKATRCHHHLVMDGMLDMDNIESKWKLGKRNETRRLDKDEYGLTGMAEYITKEPQGKKRWCSSMNLEQPKIRKNHKFNRKSVETMVRHRDSIKEIMQEKYKDCYFSDVNVYFNDFNSLFYMHIRMRKKVSENVI